MTEIDESKEVGMKLTLTHENDYIYLWYKKRYLRISKVKEKLEAADDFRSMFNRTYSISGLFSRKAITHLLDHIMRFGREEELKARTEKEVVKIYSVTPWGEMVIVDPKAEGKTFKHLFNEEKDAIIADLEAFKADRELYKRLKIPFKRGYMFYGTPGNGKSSYAYAIAEYLKYDLYIITLNGLSDGSFQRIISDIPSHSIIVIEDIDSFYDKREAIADNKVSFSAFINALSGITQKNDILTIFTTNKIEQLDDALLREGRCDVKIEVKGPTKQAAEQFLSYMYDRPIQLEEYDTSLSFAKLQNEAIKYIDNPTVDNPYWKIKNVEV